MKRVRLFTGVLLSLSIIIASIPAAYAETGKAEFVDLAFTANNRVYYSNNVSKVLMAAPYMEGSVLMVPSEVLLSELGFSYVYGTKDSSITAKRGNMTIVLKLSDRFAVVNGARKDMGVTPKKPNGKKTIFLPAAAFARIAGADQLWDPSAKTLEITRTGRYDVGTVMFYEKTKEGNRVYVYDGNRIKEIELGRNEIVNWYAYKGQVLVTIFNTSTNKNNFAIFRNNGFSTMIDDFDILDTFEFNNNLLIHGYDRSRKFNKLYRFDGKSLILVEDNFYVGQHILFKDKLVINKYDNNRNYTLVAFDKSSWSPGTLAEGFVLKDSIEYEGTLYMTGLWQEGVNKPLAAYDGESVGKTSFKILSDNINVNVNMIAVHNDKLYAVVDKDLVTIDRNSVEIVSFPYAGSYMRYIVADIKEYKGKLYLATTGAKKPGTSAWSTISDKDMPAAVIEFNSTNDNKRLIDEFKASELRIENNILLALGNKRTKVSTYNDPALFGYNTSKLAKTQDVLKIENVISVGDNTFLDVRDRDRMSGKDRNTVILLTNMEFKNLVVGMDTKKWDEVEDGLVLGGYEADIKRNKLYSYRNTFSELSGNFEIKYWDKIADTLFMDGYDQEKKKYNFCKIDGKKLVTIREDIEVKDMIKASNDYYLVYGTDRNIISQYKNKKVLYIYDDAKKQLVEMKVGIEIADMIFVE